MNRTARLLSELRTTLERAATDVERVDALLVLGTELVGINPHEGRALATEALSTAERIGDRHAGARARQLVGMLCVQFGELSEALAHLERAAREFESLDDRNGVARSALLRGLAFKGRSQLGEALEMYAIAARLYEELDDRVGIGNSMLNIGSVRSDLGDYATALESYRDALAMFESAGSQLGVARATGSIGSLHGSRGDDEKALESYRDALRMFDQIGDPGDIAVALANAAGANLRLGDHDIAMRQLLSARTLFESLGERDGLARVSRQIGDALSQRGEYARAIEHFRAALALAEEQGDRAGVACALGEIGSLHALEEFEERDRDRAEGLLERAVEMLTEIGAKSPLATYHERLAALYERQGRWRESHGHLTRSRALGEELRSIEARKLSEHLAMVKRVAELDKRRELERLQEKSAREALSLRAQILESQIDQQRAELVAQAVHMARQAEVLAALRSELLEIVRSGDDPNGIVRRLSERLKRLPTESIEWARFEADFRTLYPDFQARLIQRCPDLSGMELKVCALLKLRLISADIARILHLSERSVEGHRLKIRRKLGLGGREDVHETLAAI